MRTKARVEASVRTLALVRNGGNRAPAVARAATGPTGNRPVERWVRTLARWAILVTSAKLPLGLMTRTANRAMKGKLVGMPAKLGWWATYLVLSEAATPMARAPT